jgi:hypothetical protein
MSDPAGNPPVAVPCNWLIFDRTHPRNKTCDQGCVIHNRTPHHMQYWLLHWRGDRNMFERICPHGIGHPDPDQFPYWDATGQEAEGVHGCDGCCAPPATDPPPYCLRCGIPHTTPCKRGDT